MPAYPLALPDVTGDVFALDAAAIARGTEAARASPRRRIMLRVNRSGTEGVQRLVNFLQSGSYIRPHRHPAPECVENVTVLQGAVVFLIFDPHGALKSSHRLIAGRPDACMVDVEQGVWHTLVPLVDDTVVLEIKRGPYDSATDKQFATWAPAEGTPEAEAWVREMALGEERDGE